MDLLRADQDVAGGRVEVNAWQTKDEQRVDRFTLVCCILTWASVAVLVAMLFSGCTVLNIQQRDESPDERVITTTIKAVAWFSSAQSITKLKTLNTDKTQSVGTDAIAQQGATNTLATLNALARILEALRPTP